MANDQFCAQRFECQLSKQSYSQQQQQLQEKQQLQQAQQQEEEKASNA